MPLSDRDYMQPQRPRPRPRRVRGQGLELNPLLVIIALNLLVFVITSFSRPVFTYLAFIPADFAARPWNVLTCMFVHAGISHLIFNMLALYFLGRNLLMLVGNRNFLIVYFVGGLAGSFVYYLLNTASFGPVVGASGAVYAIAGALVVLIPTVRVSLWGIVPMPLWVFVAVFLVILSMPSFVDSNVAWQAHFGGLAAGIIAGLLFRRRGKFYYIVR